MSNDVERLVQMLLAECGGWMTPERARRTAERLLGNGVTLPTPPRATPLEAACRSRWAYYDEMSDREKRSVKDSMTRDIAAAVGALSDDDVEVIVFDDVPESGGVRKPAALRAALLARLTEGGTS